MKAPVRVWEIDRGKAHGMRLDVSKTVEFELRPGDTQPISGQPHGARSEPVMVEVERLRPWEPTWGGAGAA